MKRVAILGYAESIKLAPFGDPTVELWIPNYCEVEKVGLPRKPNRIFELHSWEIILSENTHSVDGINSLERMAKETIPIYMVQENKAIPSSKTYPIDELTREFFPWAKKINGKWDGCYWTSSAQMMIALAIKEEYEEIAIYGVHMADKVEYREQRKGCEYVLGFAVARGINVILPNGCPILKTRFIYGYDVEEEKSYRKWLNDRKEFLNKQIADLNAAGTRAAGIKMQYEGHLLEIGLLEDNWLNS